MFLHFLILGLTLGSASPVDSLFLKRSAQDNVAELQIARMVASKTKNPEVKKACEVMIKDHTNQYSEIKKLGKNLGVDLPTDPDPMQQAIYKHMSEKSGKDLDKAFTAAQLQDHINDVNEAQDESEMGESSQVRDLAKAAVKTLAKHEHIWRVVAKDVGVNSVFGRPSAEQILAGAKISD